MLKAFPNFSDAISNNVLVYDYTTKYYESVKDEKITTIGVETHQRKELELINKNEKQEHTRNETLLHSFNDQPSRKIEFESGRLCFQFHQFGKLHRINGPAEILYSEDGVTILEQYFWLFDVNVTEEYFRIYIRDFKIKNILD